MRQNDSRIPHILLSWARPGESVNTNGVLRTTPGFWKRHWKRVLMHACPVLLHTLHVVSCRVVRKEERGYSRKKKTRRQSGQFSPWRAGRVVQPPPPPSAPTNGAG